MVSPALHRAALTALAVAGSLHALPAIAAVPPGDYDFLYCTGGTPAPMAANLRIAADGSRRLVTSPIGSAWTVELGVMDPVQFTDGERLVVRLSGSMHAGGSPLQPFQLAIDHLALRNLPQEVSDLVFLSQETGAGGAARTPFSRCTVHNVQLLVSRDASS